MKKLFLVLAVMCGLFVFSFGCDEAEDGKNAASMVLLLGASAARNVDCYGIDTDASACYTNVQAGWCSTFNGDAHETGWCTDHLYTDCSGNRCLLEK
jgi:hypothetical protein